VAKHLSLTDKVLIVEEVICFIEDSVKILAAELASEIGAKTFYGKRDRTIPMVGELNPDQLISALSKVLGIEAEAVPESYSKRAGEVGLFGAPQRELTFCPGCPHRASFWSIHNALQLDNRQGFVCGDIGCYSMGVLPAGFTTLKTLHAMGTGTGLASGFGKLGQFGMDQPVLSVCGDSTFFHSAIPALVNAVHHKSDITMVVLDNSGTGMTGFQPHPGLTTDALGTDAPAVDIAEVCRAIGARVEICDPFDIETTQKTLLDLLQDKDGVKVMVLRQICALSPEKKSKKLYDMTLDEEVCFGENCGCNQLCTRIFRCPGLVWNLEKKVAKLDEVICTGCGVCASICPSGAIQKKEAA
jgi:indolepyruvate ferredoxin oxidoreductase alpha subunit